MKRVISALVALAAMVSFGTEAKAYNNENTFGKGDVAVNVGLHMGQLDGEGMLGIGASAEYGIMENLIKDKGSIGVGLMVGYGTSKSTQYHYVANDIVGVKVNYTNSIFRLATRGVFHYQFIPQLDTYAGATFGIADFVNQEAKVDDKRVESYDKEHTNFCGGMFAGARYMFSDSFGLNAELGLDDFSYFSVGVAFKF